MVWGGGNDRAYTRRVIQYALPQRRIGRAHRAIPRWAAGVGPAELLRRVQRHADRRSDYPGRTTPYDRSKWAFFDANRCTTIAQIRDGTSNTMCIAESLTGPEGYYRGFLYSDQPCGAWFTPIGRPTARCPIGVTGIAVVSEPAGAKPAFDLRRRRHDRHLCGPQPASGRSSSGDGRRLGAFHQRLDR